MLDRLKLKGLGSIPLLDLAPEPNKDYLIALIIQRDGIFEPDSQGEEIEGKTFVMKVIRPYHLQEIGTSKQIKIQKGKTKSQILRFILQEYFDVFGMDNIDDKAYNLEMDKISNYYRKKIDTKLG